MAQNFSSWMRPQTLCHRLLCPTPKARFFPTLNSTVQHIGLRFHQWWWLSPVDTFSPPNWGITSSKQRQAGLLFYGTEPPTLNGRGSWTPMAWCSVTALKHPPVPAGCWECPKSTPPSALCLTCTATGRGELQVIIATSRREGPREWQVRHQRAQLELREESRRGLGGSSKAELRGKGKKFSAF